MNVIFYSNKNKNTYTIMFVSILMKSLLLLRYGWGPPTNNLFDRNIDVSLFKWRTFIQRTHQYII